MRVFAVALCLAGSVFINGAARADFEEKLWVAQCVRDNAGSEASTKALVKYCSCMNNKMDDEETKSVTDWAISHPDEKAVCETNAGLNARAPAPAPAAAPVPAPAAAPVPAPAPAPGAASGSGN